ncbi:MAG: F0F1 ATP synthase subunit gamma [Syntrophomonadaceae bacterium]
MDTIESLQRKMNSAATLKEVVRTMKAIAASNIVQFDNAAIALEDYYHTVKLGLRAYFFGNPPTTARVGRIESKGGVVGAIILGADQGFVGQFNEAVADYAAEKLLGLTSGHIIWAVGERMREYLNDAGFVVERMFDMPSTVQAITPLVGDLLLESEMRRSRNEIAELYIFYNQHVPEAVYKPHHERLLPLDEMWLKSIYELPWPTQCLPEVSGVLDQTLLALIHEYLFVSVFRACTQSMATENACRLATTQRADEKIGETLRDLLRTMQDMRQNQIDAELFDVVAGFETMVQTKS